MEYPRMGIAIKYYQIHQSNEINDEDTNGMEP
jgi:hypothetical protein